MANMVLCEALMPWQKLNVTAFFTSGIIASESGLMGE